MSKPFPLVASLLLAALAAPCLALAKTPAEPDLTALAPLSTCEDAMVKAANAWLERENSTLDAKESDKSVFARMISDSRGFSAEQVAQARAKLAATLSEFDLKAQAGQAEPEEQTIRGFLSFTSDFLACHPKAKH
jgi:hypothetical protein